MLYRDDIGIKFPYSLLYTSEMKFFHGDVAFTHR